MARSPLVLTVGSLRRRARRSLALRWAAAAVAAAVAAAGAVRAEARAEAAREAWSRSVPVAVWVVELGPGDVVGPGDAVVERRPSAVLPVGAVAEAPVGQVVTSAVVPGEVVVEARLAPGGLRGAAALLPPGWVAVAVPSAIAPPVRVGDRVAVLGPDHLAEAIVVAVDDDDATISVGVALGEVEAVVEAVAAGFVVLALRGG